MANNLNTHFAPSDGLVPRAPIEKARTLTVGDAARIGGFY